MPGLTPGTRVLVVGANGFIGSHLAERLAREAVEVTAFDRFSDGTAQFDPSVVSRVIVGDFLDADACASALEGQDVVIHLLSSTSPATSDGDPLTDIAQSVLPSVRFLDQCVRAGVKRVVFASTGGAIYGQGDRDHSESDLPKPVSPYAIGKLSLEHYLRYYRVKHGLASVVLRISNPYGPRQKPARAQGLIPIALRHVRDGEPVPRFGDGTMVRDYVYIADLVEMIAAIVLDSAPRHGLYNLGSGVGHEVNEVLEMIREVTGLAFSLVELPAPPTFVRRAVVDPSRFEGEFGAVELTPIAEGIRLTWTQADAPRFVLDKDASSDRYAAPTFSIE